MSKDCIYLMYCLSFVTSHLCLKFALIPILCQALVHVANMAKFLRRNFGLSSLYRKYLEESNTTTLSILSSHAEIGIGFLLIISLFLCTDICVLAAIEAHVSCSVTSDYHLSVWTTIGRTAHPFIRRYAPFLETPLLSWC